MIIEITIISVCLAYLCFTYYVYLRIIKAIYLSENRRKLHKRFIWFVPFIGPLIIRNFWKRNIDIGIDVMTKSKRKLDKSNFYESGKGIFGG